MRLGIDASNIRGGGGVTHIRELLKEAEPQRYGFSEVRIWARAATLDKLEQRDWLELDHQPLLDGTILSRSYWQRYKLNKLAKNQCDLLFVPGGLLFSSFRPVVTMSQNLLPFEAKESARYGISYTRFRLRLLRRRQSQSFCAADGVIFLSNYAKATVEASIGKSMRSVSVIPHGVSSSFLCAPRSPRSPEECTSQRPFRILYVSIVDVYKHQEKVAAAVARLRREGVWIVLELVGPAYPPALRSLNRAIRTLDRNREFIRYGGAAYYADLPALYRNSDLFVFASSCETFGMILIEAMAAGLPIACSERGPMRELLQDGGCYFDPEDAGSIYDTLRQMYLDRNVRSQSAERAFAHAQTYSWKTCAERTFSFFASVAQAKG